MCNASTLELIKTNIVREVMLRLGDKLDSILLYGSYAREDFDDDSDIDIMVLANVSIDEANKIERELISLTSSLGLEYNVLISLYIKDCDTFNKWKDVLPFYQNVIRDGVRLIA